MGAILYKDKVYGVGGSIIEGYYKSADGKFYEESTYETEILGAEDLLYIDLTSKMQFIFDGTNFVNITEDAKPTVTEASSRTNIASGDTLKTIIGKIKKFFADLKTVAFTGAYSDLSGTPTIPTVNNATLTIQKNGTAVETFTANASSNKTANITVPTKLSDLTDDVVAGNYLSKNGGTIGAGTVATPLEIKGTSEAWVKFIKSDGTTIGWIGVNQSGEVQFFDSAGHSLAYKSDLSSYLPLTGGSLTGNLNVSGSSDTSLYTHGNASGSHIGFRDQSGNTTYGYIGVKNDNLPYFYANNSSKRIALTSDRVAMASEHYNKYEVDLSTGDVNVFYPVTGTPLNNYYVGYVHMTVFVVLNSGTVPSWSTHERGFSVFLDILNEAQGWGATWGTGICLANDFGWCGDVSPCGYSQMTNSSTPVFWCRGGGKYFIYSDHPMAWSVRTSTYTVSGQSVSPRSTNPGVSLSKVPDIMANITGKANALSNTSAIGSNVQTPIYFDANGHPSTCYNPASGAWFRGIPFIGSNGVMEIGKYIDFHNSNTSTADYDARITASTSGLTLSGTTIGTFNGDLHANNIAVDSLLEINGYVHWPLGNYEIEVGTVTLTANRTINYPNASGTISVSGSSSRRTKKNIENMTDAEAKKLLDLRPVKFDYITKEDGTDCYGLIAEEVQDAGIEYPLFTHHDKRLDEDVPALEYSKFVPYLIKMVQLQQQEIDLLKQEVASLKRDTPR